MNRTANRRVKTFVALFFCAAILFVTGTAAAAELAVLRNGFTIRHDHRKAIGDTTRLFLSADDSSFTDVSTAEITGYEKDLVFAAPAVKTLVPAPVVQPASTLPRPVSAPAFTPSKPAQPATDLNQVVNSASAAHH